MARGDADFSASRDQALCEAAGRRALTISLHRVRRGRALAFATMGPAPEPPPRPHPSRGAQMLALAHEFQRLIDAGEVPDRAALAAQVGLTRARVTQIMDLLLLAPDIQEAVLLDAEFPCTERQLRRATHHLAWSLQRRAFTAAIR